MRLSVQERNLICIYRSGSREETMCELAAAMPFIDEPDILTTADSAIRKLGAMSDDAFTAFLSGEASP
jgi:hypothetical protein